MHRRITGAAICAALLWPACAAAQLMPLQDDPFWTPRVRITPFIGFAPGYTRLETWIYGGEQINPELQVDGAPVFGLQMEMGFRGRFALLASGAYAGREEMPIIEPSNEPTFVDGSHFLIGKFGLAYQLREQLDELVMHRLNASVFAAPTIMFEVPRTRYESGRPYQDERIHFGASFGATGELPFASDRFALQVGIEDHIMWWFGRRDLAWEYFGAPADGENVRARGRTSNVWLMRAGVSLRMR